MMSVVRWAQRRAGGSTTSTRHRPWLLVALSGTVAATMLLPIAYLLLRTLDADGDVLRQLVRPRTLQVLWQTVLLAASVTAGSIALGAPLAWLTTSTDLPARRWWAVVIVLPLVIPSYVGGYVFVSAFGPRGLLQQMLAPFGVERLPELYGFWGAWLVLTLLSYPYIVLNVQAALRNLDPALEEAARSLGYDARHTFWRVTLPQLRPALAAGGLLVTLYTLSEFGAVSLLQFNSFSRAIYVQYRSAFNRDYAAALALILVVLTAIVLVAETWTRGRGRYHRSTVGVVKPRPLVHLGRWRWVALIGCGLVAGIALVVPIGVVIYWLLRGVLGDEPLRLLWGAAFNSILSSALAAVLAVCAALPVAVLAVRFRSRLSSLFEGTTYLGYALPGIVLALALVRFASQYTPWVYQTLALMVFAYVLRFLPQALGALRASLLTINPRVEEAARSLGQSPANVARRVTLPLIRSGLLGGGALVFLTAMKELPITLLLGPIGFRTLATATWSATAEGFFARAAAPALLLILVSAMSMVLVIRDTLRR